MGALTDLRMVNEGREAEITGTSKLQEISEDDENMSLVAFPSYPLTHTFHHLRQIYFAGFEGMEVLLDIESPSTNIESATTQQQLLPLLPCLEELQLENMDMCLLVFTSHVQTSFQPKDTRIQKCEGMEEVVLNKDRNDDDEEEEVSTISTTALFPRLDLVQLYHLDNLKRVGGGVAKGKSKAIHDQFKFSQVGAVSWSLCQYFIKIEIVGCHALSSLIPSYAAAQMHKLQELRIYRCTSMVEVFETKEIDNYGCSASNVDQGTIPLPRPKNITIHHELTNLKILKIFECNLLEYVFTFSTLESLKKLETLSIQSCKAMKVIVREENGEESSKVVLPRLISVKLHDLPNLVGFFLGMNIDYQMPSLDYVMITECPQMMVFTPTYSKFKYIHSWLGKHNVECGLNFHETPSSESSSLCRATAQRTLLSFNNLVEMFLKDNNEPQKIVPSTELHQLQNLEKVHVNRCVNVEELFEVASDVTNNGSQTVVKFPKLREMELKYLSSFKYICKRSEPRILEFPNLTRLLIHKCNRLEHVFTASMVSTLMQLQELHISYTRSMEVIVKKEEECDGKASEIKLPCLKSLKLEYLASLKGFSLGKENFTLPSLNTLVIKECPQIRIFNDGRAIAPELKLVETSFGIFHAEEDINSFIMTKIQETHDKIKNQRKENKSSQMFSTTKTGTERSLKYMPFIVQ
ncbi:hypothetical protein L1987_39575 [Smallanthus sonchifolius]|uniref:Uncharacterized protein n=1 Tax=Smallanthus sonchifolius TaxID=185202 RepID=A0ACB9HN99_9ASTR|nr:hypothetical protein L1987_39575 [Smallanthus sonchifolius]